MGCKEDDSIPHAQRTNWVDQQAKYLGVIHAAAESLKEFKDVPLEAGAHDFAVEIVKSLGIQEVLASSPTGLRFLVHEKHVLTVGLRADRVDTAHFLVETDIISMTKALVHSRTVHIIAVPEGGDINGHDARDHQYPFFGGDEARLGNGGAGGDGDQVERMGR